MAMKQNDWIIANMNNPTFDVGDFRYISDMSLDNTQLLPKEQYLKSDFIRQNDMFKNNKGEFSESIFSDFYNGAVEKFADFSTENIIDNYEYSMWDVMRPKGGKVKKTNFALGTVQNPTHMGIGIAGFNEVTNSSKSQKELAQASKIYDPATGKFLDYSVDDISLWNNPIGYFKSLFDDPLVYATYDQDTEEIDPITGNKILHRKGEWKVNEQGEFYTEKLNGRSLMGKQVVSAGDYLTPENSIINKYDFFDSDDLQKSVGGTIAKNVASIIPMLIPYVRIAYSGLLVAREMGKSLPMLYGMMEGLSGSDNADSQLANTIAAYGHRMTGGTSEYAQNNTFSFENFGNLMSDVALQWGQQRFIANTFSKLTGGGKKAMDTAYARAQKEYLNRTQNEFKKVFTGETTEARFAQYTGVTNLTKISEEVEKLITTGKWAETAFGTAAKNRFIPTAQKAMTNRMRMGQDLSLVYMAIVSNTDVYESVLEHGGSPFEAAAIALGSTIGMFSVDKYAHLGEIFFDSDPARKALRESARNNAAALMRSAGIKPGEAETKKGIMGLIQKGINSGRKTIQNYQGALKERTLGFFGKSLGEAFEEVSEELVADMSKTLGELAGRLGYFSQTDYGAWDNAFDRYAMSFLGGAAGGGLFYGVEAFQNRNRKAEEFQSEITYLLKQGKKDEILAELRKMRDKGQLGSKTLSYKTTKDKNNKDVYLTASEEDESQSDYIYNTLVSTINQLDMILNENQIGLSDDELFDRMVQGEYRSQALSDFLIGDSRKNNAQEVSYITRYQQDFHELSQKIINKEKDIQSLSDPEKRGDVHKEKLNKLMAEKQALLDQRDYLFGEGSLGYVEKMLFAIDTNLSGNFVSLTYDQFVRHNLGKSVKDLTEAEKEKMDKAFAAYSKTNKMNLDEAFKLFKDMQKKLNPEIQTLSESDIAKGIEQFKKISELDPFARYLNYDSKMDDESEEDYADRYHKREDEDEDAFKARIEKRQQLIDQYNSDHLSEWVSELAQHPIDRNTYRILQARIGQLKKTARNKIIETYRNLPNTETTHKVWNLIKNAGEDEKSRAELLEQIEKIVYDGYYEEYSKALSDKGFLGSDWLLDIIRPTLKYLSNASPEVRAQYGFPEIWSYNPEVPLTMGEVVSAFQAFAKDQELKTNRPFTVQDTIDWLTEGGWFFPEQNTEQRTDQETSEEETKGEKVETVADLNQRIIDFYTRVQSGISNIGDPEAGEYVEFGDNTIRMLAEKATEPGREQRAQDLKKMFERLDNDSNVKMLTDLENASFVNNPVMPLLKKISQQIRDNELNIEQMLEEINSQYQNGEQATDFELSSSQVVSLKQFKKDIEMAKAFIHAASSTSDYNNPVGHNKSINEFISNHHDVFGKVEPLPEIDKQTADFLIGELNNYNREIDFWIQRSQMNIGDKVQKFIKADAAINKVKLEFYEINREKFKINPTLDLLKGYDDLTLDNSLTSVVQVEELLHRNYNNAIKNGVTLEAILKSIVPKITNLDSINTQITARLDENLEYKHLTDYDKFGILVSNFAYGSVEFYNKLRDFITKNDNLAPLSIQEYVTRMTQAQGANPEVINTALKYIGKELNMPILENTTIATGVGGAGKTFAIARITTNNGEDTWVSGPDKSQVDNLLSKDALPKATGKSKEELLQLALGKDTYASFKSDLEQKKSSSKYWKKTKVDGTTTVILKDTVKVKKVDKAPKFLVIDEATHFSTAELQVLSKFAKENNIQLILMGDENQNGFIAQDLMYNINREVVLAWRPPKLFISLRENNTQKIKNLQSCISIMDQITITSSVDETINVTKKLLKDDFANFTLNYYNGDKFYGELITDNLSNDIVSKLDGDIGFIGEENSPYYKQLKEAGKNPILVNPLAVQGREFDYVIIDKDDWEIKINPENLEDTALSIRDFMKDLYTMISRSRKGSILINKPNLQKHIRNVQDDFTGETTSVKKATEEFRKIRLQQINEALEAVKPEAKEPEGKPKKEPKEAEKPTTDPTKEPEKKLEEKPKAEQTEEQEKEDTPTTETTTEEKPEEEQAEEKQEEKKPEKSKNQLESTTSESEKIDEQEDSSSTDEESKEESEGEPEEDETNRLSVSESEEESTIIPPDTQKQLLDGATYTSLEDIQEEETPEESNEDFRQIEKTDSEIEEEKSYLKVNTPIRVYTNVHHSGIDTSQEIWSNETDTMKDLGIFLRKGQVVANGQEKYNLVKKLIDLKSLIIFGNFYWDRAESIKDVFSSKDVLNQDNMEYYVSIQDESPAATLVGLTDNFKNGLKSDKKLVSGKIVTLVAKIKDGDNTYTVTLGGLANPVTWRQKEPDIRLAIRSRIDNGDPDSERLKQYLDNLDANITAYENKIAEWTSKNQEIRIKKPDFSGLTTLIDAGENLRLENFDSTFSPFDDATAYAVKSKVHNIVDDIPGVKMTYIDGKGRTRTLKGRAVIYVSSNSLLYPSELENLYWEQKNNPHLNGQVRMIVLDNEGVSFQSLYRRRYKDLYSMKKGKALFTNPFKLEPMAIRMYISAWNFRSNLQTFLRVYDDWIRNNELDDNTVEQLCKLDREEYYRAKGEQEYLSEEDYRNQVSNEIREKLQPIWDFNDSLHDSVRQFRLGYDSQNGVYIRKITNLKEGGFYKDIDDTLGIYINPSMARQFNATLDALFKNIINKIIPTEYDTSETRKVIPRIDDNLAQGWFQNVKDNQELEIQMFDDDGKIIDTKLNVSAEDALLALPSVLIETAKFLEIATSGPGHESFKEYLEQQAINLSEDSKADTRYFMKFGEEPLDWQSLLDTLEGGVYDTNEDTPFVEGEYPPGVRPLDTKQNWGVIDKRIDNLFSLMFHGTVSLKYYNNFNRGDIRATDAKFKFGFKVDPMRESSENDHHASIEVLTNRKFFSSNVVPGFPQIGIDVESYEETEQKVVQTENTQTAKVNENLQYAKDASVTTLKESGIRITKKDLDSITSMEQLLDLVTKKINNKFAQYFKQRNDFPIEKLITDAKINDGKIEFTYLSLPPELNGDPIVDQKWENGARVITTNSGNKFEVRKLGNNLQWTSITDPQPKNRTVGQVKEQIRQELDKISGFISTKDTQTLNKIIDEGFNTMSDDKVAGDKLTRKIINAIQEELQVKEELKTWKKIQESGNAESDEDADWYSTLERVNDELEKLKNDNCPT